MVRAGSTCDERGEPRSTSPHVLDNPIRASLLGPHAPLAERCGDVLRYPVDVAPFVSLPEVPDADTWRDLSELCAPGTRVGLSGVPPTLPVGWDLAASGSGVQLVGADVTGADDAEAVVLGAADVPDMLALVEHAKPGPFLARTVELGNYLGIRHGGRLVAMAGERMHPPGWTEISAVCTDAAWRGRGLATRLVLAVAAGIQARGESPFMHAAATNLNAIRLYESLGFRLRRTTTFLSVIVPSPGV